VNKVVQRRDDREAERVHAEPVVQQKDIEPVVATQ